MRFLLNTLYLACGYLSGFCIILITLIISAQIVGRLFGFIVPSAEDFSGYALAASTFFGLAYTFRHGGHIRVTLVIQHWSRRSRYIQELLVLVFGLLLVSFMSFYAIHMVWESYVFEELSSGYIAVPIWMPQVPVALGILVLNIAILDDVISVLRRHSPSYKTHEGELHLEEI
ncbi:MAG: TRAP-type C4-dicarboxylate transport system permease small subunit [Motiliproteus sp.]|jgi:TRAP-type C4-dicarboxylate transport system permease small subunit